MGPSKEATPVHPIKTDKPIRVTSPMLTFENARHDSSGANQPAYPYGYEIQLSADEGFKTLLHVDHITGPEISTNHGLSYLRYPLVLPVSADKDHKQVIYWRVRPIVGNAPGRWSKSKGSFYVLNPLPAPEGLDWQDPILDVAHDQLRITGTFNEGYHGGDLQTRLHGGLDYGARALSGANICGKPIYAIRGGVLVRRNTELESVRTITLHHSDAVDGEARRSRYLHMEHSTTTPFKLGVYINQGTELGTMSNLPNHHTPPRYPCHLHLDLTSADEKTLYNPLTVLSWDDFYSPTITQTFVRSSNLLSSPGTNVITNVHFMVSTRDTEPLESKTSPYRVEFYINDVLQCQQTNAGVETCTIQFDELVRDLHEHQFYGFNSAAVDGRTAAWPAGVSNSEPRLSTHMNQAPHGFLMYYKWNPPADLRPGPIDVRVVASDYYGNSDERTMRVGPDLTAVIDSTTSGSNTSYTVNVCSNEPTTVTLTLNNENTNITQLGNTSSVREAKMVDTFALTSTVSTGITMGTTLKPTQAVKLDDKDRPSGVTKSQSYTLPISFLDNTTQSGTIQIVARSGIITPVKDVMTLHIVRKATCP